MSDEVIRQTRQWIEQNVLQLNLCPFAKQVYEAEHIEYRVIDGADFESLYKAFLAALLDFVDSDPQQIVTGFIIFSAGLSDFECYLDFVALCERALLDAGLQGMVQIASFHPQYCFAEVPENAASNYSNRSPWPMLHLLREADMAAALSQYKHPEKIPLRNQNLLDELGADTMKHRLQRIRSS